MYISQASLTHLEALYALENAIFDAQSFPLSKRNFIYHLKKGNIFVAQKQTQLVGYILIFSYKKSLRIYSLAVDKNFRGKKVGFALVQYVKDLANAAHKRKLTLEVKTSNKNAIRFYEKFGFKIM
jgi:ribosomal-protein-alanine N-acetyltransferase